MPPPHDLMIHSIDELRILLITLQQYNRKVVPTSVTIAAYLTTNITFSGTRKTIAEVVDLCIV